MLKEGYIKTSQEKEKVRDTRKWNNTTRRHLRVLPTESTKPARLPAILGVINDAGGGGAPIERENGGDHLMAIENTEKKRRRKKYIYK